MDEESILIYGVEYQIVTDSPLLTGLVYCDPLLLTTVEDTILSNTQLFQNTLNVFIERGDGCFEQEGRLHNLEQSIIVDTKIKEMLRRYKIEYVTIGRDDVAEIICYL